MLFLGTLGGFEIRQDDATIHVPRARERALLVYLACESAKRAPRADLARMFWPESSPRDGLHALRQSLYRLTRTIPTLEFEADQKLLRLLPSCIALDLREFREAITRRAFTRADRMYRGAFLEGFVIEGAPEFDAWVEAMRASLGALTEDYFRAFLAELETEGRWAESERVAHQLLLLNPLDQVAGASEVALLTARGAVREAKTRYLALTKELRAAGVSLSARLRDLGTALADPDAEALDLADDPGLPMIGRGSDFDRVRKALVTAQAGQGSILVISGAAGVGKTRMAQQAQRLAVLKGFRRAAANCSTLTLRLPYSAAKQLLQAFAPTDLQSVGPELLPYLQNILSVAGRRGRDAPGVDDLEKEGFYEAFWSVICAASRRTPVIMVIEDAHWIDNATCEMLGYLAPRIPRERCIFLLTARSGEATGLGSRHGISIQERSQHIILSELGPNDVRELVAAFGTVTGKDVPEGTAQIVGRLAAGHPFFVLELLREWRREPATLRADVPLPRSIEQFLSERFTALSGPALQVAEALAVMGGTARHDELPLVASLTEDEYGAAVDELLATGFAKDGAEGLSLLHEIVREAAYRRMNHARRRVVHARVVKVLRSGRTLDAGSLAYHSELAGDSWSAFRYAMAAGELAARRYGHAEAEPYWRLALKHAGTEASWLRATGRLADACYRLSRYAEALSWYKELLAHPASAPTHLLFRARLTGLEIRLGQLTHAEEPLRDILTEARRFSDANVRLNIYEPVFFAAATANRFDLIREFGEDFAAAAEAAMDSAAKVILLTNLAESAAFAGGWAEAQHYLNVAMACARHIGHQSLLAHAHSALGTVAMLRGDTRTALENFRRALDITETSDTHLKRPHILANWAILMTEMGMVAEARRCFTRSLEWAEESGSVYNKKMALANLAVSEFEAGDLQRAREAAEAALGVGSLVTAPSTTASTIGLLGLLALEMGTVVASSLRSQLVDQFPSTERTGADFSYAEIFLARMSEREGRLGEALERIERAAGMYAGRDFFCHARLELERARLVGVSDPQAGLAIAREVRGRAVEAEAVLLLNKSEALMRELKRRSASSRRARPEAEDRGVGTRAERSRR